MTTLVISTWNWGRDLFWTRVAGFSIAAWLFVGGVNLAVCGWLWDGGWHASWGRDTFFIPPHDMIYSSVALELSLAGFIIISSSLRERDPGLVHWLRFQAPLGVWIIFLGVLTMVTAAPIDDWYHRTFGRDDGSGNWSPPHMLGIIGGLVGILGTLVILLQEQNLFANPNARSPSPSSNRDGDKPRGLHALNLSDVVTLLTFSYVTFNVEVLSLNFWGIRDWYRTDGTLYPILAMVAGPATLVLAQRLTRRAGAATFIVVYSFVVVGLMGALLTAFGFPVVISLPVMGIPSALILDFFYAHYGSNYRALLVAAPLAVLVFYPTEYLWAWYLSGQPWWSLTNSLLTMPVAIVLCTASTLFGAWGAERIRELKIWQMA